MRVFAAATIERFAGIDDLMSDLLAIKGCRPVRTPELHLTFRFFGEIEGNLLEHVRKEFKNIQGKRFNLKIEGMGAFPKPVSANVSFLNVQSSREISEIHNSISEMKPVVKDGKPFIPHITVARFNVRADCRELCKKYEMLSYESPIERISLYKSDLTSSGPVYTEIERVQL